MPNVTVSMAKGLVAEARRKGKTPEDQLGIIQSGVETWGRRGYILEAAPARIIGSAKGPLIAEVHPLKDIR